MASTTSKPLQELFAKMSSKAKSDKGGGDTAAAPMDGEPKSKKNKIEDIYQKKTQLEHILLRPDTYIGSIESVTENMWVIEEGAMVQKMVTYVPGLFKIFDEILVNAADNKQRDNSMDTIKIDIDQENNQISIWNNGQGIPVVEHQKEKMMVPTMIFGHLLTSSNFNDEEKKVTGGRNGYGAKLCNVFSYKFIVETANKKYKRAFKQVWENNMSKTTAPKVRDFDGNDYTKITFKPDLEKFKMESLSDDIVAIFNRRAYDIAASTRGIKVFLNGKRLPVKNFKDYVGLFLNDRKDETGGAIKVSYEQVNERWEIAVCRSDNGFQQNSFVNSIATLKGGRHVDYVTDLVVKNLVETIKKKNKNGLEIKPAQIKYHMWLFVNCLIENPTFDSQTKEHMTLQAKQFGSKCVPSEKFYTTVIKSGIVESVLQWAKFKAESLLNKGSGKKSNKIKGIPKLEDANLAGTKNSSGCTLILTEGDSAKTLAVAGLGVVGRDTFGVFPLRGKLLNVREASHKQIMDNAEISALVKIIGLQYKRKYLDAEEVRTLRYGKLMIMTDQDHDGSHIKGLIINFIHHNWPNLLKMNFIEEFITPIVKATKTGVRNQESISFYSMPELDEWKKNTANWKTYNLKYYKGLGTSTSKEAKEYFTDMHRHRIKFKYQGTVDDDQITMAFSKKCIEQRKDWLTNWMEGCKRRKDMGMNEDVIYSKEVSAITYSDFINKELVLFSNLDNERSIPCLVDGLKPGQRKVLYTCMKRNDKKDVKVAQLAGSVAEHSAYHHGEQSLMSTIINLAQNYVGSNNINLLMPIGQFGTRLQGGKDSASPRYIFTKLSSLTRLIFNAKDDAILKNLYDDNQKIEPEWYCPLIPMVLVNGADGIGTGWMTKVPNFNPREIVENIRRLIRGDEPVHMQPWYKNFKGEIIEISPHKYACNGEVSVLSDSKIEITELPIHTWTQTYKENVMEVMQTATDKVPAMINDYKEYHTDITVKFVVQMSNSNMEKYESQGLHKVFKLQTAMNLTSMVLFDKNGCLKRYDSAIDILKEFFELRMEMYVKRREHLLGALEAETRKLKNQARFIVEKCDGRVTVENKKKGKIIQELIAAKYDPDPVLAWKEKEDRLMQRQDDDDDDDDSVDAEETVDDVEKSVVGKNYNYLLGMAMWSLTNEKKDSLLKERDVKIAELEALKRKTPADLYLDDLKVFSEQLDKVEQQELEDDSGVSSKKGKGKQDKGAVKRGPNKKAIADFAPSPMGRKVRPVIDDMIKKAELATKAKESKGVRGAKKKKDIKDEPEEKDEFDLLAEDANSSLLDKLNSSGEATTSNNAKGKAGAGAAKKTKNAEGGAKVGRGKKASGSGDGLKQTKLDFKKRSPGKKKKKNEWDSSEDEEVDPFEGGMDSDSDAAPVSSAPSRARSQRAAVVTKKNVYAYSSDDDEPFKSDDDEGEGRDSGSDSQSQDSSPVKQKPKTNGNAAPKAASKKKAIYSDSEAEAEDEGPKRNGKRTAADSFSDADSFDEDSPKKVSKLDSSSLFDSLVEKKKVEAVDEEVSRDSPPSSPPRPSNRNHSDSEDDIMFDTPSPVKEKPKKAPAKRAPAKPKADKADKPKKSRAKKPANSDSEDDKPAKKKRTKKGKGSDSDDDFNLSSLGGDDESWAAGDRGRRNRQAAKYVFEEEDSDF